ncbi:DUF4230 domain-containing protein [Persicitalea jodogahamensis]|uniref:DUF4230 domain-containing protein n=1 Tax=Persicitalea jodogahamensis TaxID=402147 RepID=A0A8J3D719_9BACT|nr:DUF4230 domain-containing protein [Persicitalea jodogahamensis]GHB62534.1 hypothetical protein GCM10007390_15450 [Persicitalea jodogahamensis]
MRFLRLLIQLFVIFLLMVGVISLWENWRTGDWLPNWFSQKNKLENTQTVVLQEITSLGKLELVRYNFKDIVEQQITKLWLPDAKAVLIVQGEAVGCIDLTQMDIADIEAGADTLVIHLPEPELCFFKIDHDRSKVYNTEYAFMEEAQLVQEGYKQAERQIRQSALDMGILEQTRENARKMLTPILERTSGKKVVLRFPMKADLPKLR